MGKFIFPAQMTTSGIDGHTLTDAEQSAKSNDYYYYIHT